VIYLLKSPRKGSRVRLFDGQFLVFSAGLAGMALSIVLMFLYQSQFGSLFLHIGLITALYMLGAFLGSLFTERGLARRDREPAWLLPATILAPLLLILLIAWLPDVPVRAYFAGLFLLCGACIGTYFPIAAGRMQSAGLGVAPSGSRLETLDHMGGALGAVLTGLVLLPLLGTSASLAILAILVAINIAPVFVHGELQAVGDWFERLTRPAGYMMVGVGVCLLIISQIVVAAQTGRAERRMADAARAMTGGAELEECQARLPNGTVFTYYKVTNASEDTEGFVFGSAALAKGISGYGGPITLVVSVNCDGVLRDFQVVESNETPVYLDRLALWPGTLAGRNLFEPTPFADVDAVSGATMTSEAILKTLEASARAFAAAVLGKDVAGATPAPARRLPDRDFICLATLIAAAIVMRYRPHPWARRALLLVTLVVTGFVLNLQYSAHQVMALLSGHVQSAGLNGAFFLTLGVPILVALFGNVYCGYVCPFGALQELLGDFRPKRYRTDPSKIVWRYGRAVKYMLLLLLVVLFAVTRDYAVLSADPLITIFSPVRGRAAVLVTTAVLLLAIGFRRFWCRNLCPAGAFLSLLNGLRLLRKHRPPTRPSRCDLGVQTGSELDCIGCDRCRHGKE